MLELLLVEALEQGYEIGHCLSASNRITEAINNCFLVVNLSIGDLVYLLLDESELLQVLGVVAMMRLHQLLDMLVHLLKHLG